MWHVCLFFLFQPPKTPLQKSMDILGKQLSFYSLCIIGECFSPSQLPHSSIVLRKPSISPLFVNFLSCIQRSYYSFWVAPEATCFANVYHWCQVSVMLVIKILQLSGGLLLNCTPPPLTKAVCRFHYSVLGQLFSGWNDFNLIWFLIPFVC